MSYLLSEKVAARRLQTVQRMNPNLSCYRWRIQNFSNIERKIQVYRTSTVFTSIDSKVQWRLKLFPNGKTEEDSKFMFLGLYYCSSIDVTATVELSIVNTINNEVLDAFKLKKEIYLVDNEEEGEFFLAEDHWKFARRNEIEDANNRILADSCLTISCDVNFHDPIVVPPIMNNTQRMVQFDEFGKLLKDRTFSDVTFTVGDKEIRAHKAILANHSPVFHSMFTSEMQEKEQNMVEIVDIDYVVLMELFRFMYTGTVHDIEVVAHDLFVAADKYCVERLKAILEKILLRDMKLENAVKYLITADNCNAVNLKKKTLEFIVQYRRYIVEREEFGLLSRDLMWEVTRAIAIRN